MCKKRIRKYTDEQKIKNSIRAKKNIIRKRETGRLWKINNPEKIKESKRKYLAKCKVLNKKPKPKSKEQKKIDCFKANIRNKQRRKMDPMFKMKHYLRNRINLIFKRYKTTKQTTSERLLGVSFLIVKQHLEKQFTKGMTWENHGNKGWHIDHVIPLASAKTEMELIELCHYTNLQPLWAVDNLRKMTKIPSVQIKLTL